MAGRQEKLNIMRASDFYKTIEKIIFEENVKSIIQALNSPVPPPLDKYYIDNYLSFAKMNIYPNQIVCRQHTEAAKAINFSSMGYQLLTKDEMYLLCEALCSTGYYCMGDSDFGYNVYPNPNPWIADVEKIINSKNHQLKNVYN